MSRPRRRTCRIFLAVLAGAVVAATAQEEPPVPPVMREIAPGRFEIGQIVLDQKTHSVSFPAAVNKVGKEDLLEYLLVSRDGPTHESLLVTSVQPTDVHFAMLLLGAKGSGDLGLKPGELPASQINAEYLNRAPKLTGDKILITTKWKGADGAERSASVEDWLLLAKSKKAAERGPWTYNGSMLSEGRFLAQREHIFAALVVNPSALINNPRKGNNDDQLWLVNAATVPPLDTPVEVTLTLQNPENAPPAAPEPQ